jgi:hypothetical protein
MNFKLYEHLRKLKAQLQRFIFLLMFTNLTSKQTKHGHFWNQPKKSTMFIIKPT